MIGLSFCSTSLKRSRSSLRSSPWIERWTSSRLMTSSPIHAAGVVLLGGFEGCAAKSIPADNRPPKKDALMRCFGCKKASKFQILTELGGGVNFARNFRLIYLQDSPTL